MPKRLSHEQLDSLHANGVVGPAESRDIESGFVIRALGNTGLPHDEHIETLDEPEVDVKDEFETIKAFHDAIDTAITTTTQLMTIIQQPLPHMGSPEMAMQTEQAKHTFGLYRQLGLEPDVIITPSARPLWFWFDLYRQVEASPGLNPVNRLQRGGLCVDESIDTPWSQLVPDSEGFRVEVVCGSLEPPVLGVTTYGYDHISNKNPSLDLNVLLDELNMPLVPDRSDPSLQNTPMGPQPEALPYMDTYLMQQLHRTVNLKVPIDLDSSTYLQGKFNGGGVPIGTWHKNDLGVVHLARVSSAVRSLTCGVRPSGSGQIAQRSL